MMLISVSLNLLFLTLFIRSFSEFKNNKFVLPTYIIVVLIQWYLNQNGMTFYGRWIILLLNLCYIMFMYKGKISKKLIYFIFVYFIFAISELVSILLLEIFNVVSAPIDVHSSTYLIVILTTQIISYTIGFTLSKFYHDKNTIKFTYIVLIPIIFLLGIALCYKDYREILQKNNRNQHNVCKLDGYSIDAKRYFLKPIDENIFKIYHITFIRLRKERCL